MIVIFLMIIRLRVYYPVANHYLLRRPPRNCAFVSILYLVMQMIFGLSLMLVVLVWTIAGHSAAELCLMLGPFLVMVDFPLMMIAHPLLRNDRLLLVRFEMMIDLAMMLHCLMMIGHPLLRSSLLLLVRFEMMIDLGIMLHRVIMIGLWVSVHCLMML